MCRKFNAFNRGMKKFFSYGKNFVIFEKHGSIMMLDPNKLQLEMDIAIMCVSRVDSLHSTCSSFACLIYIDQNVIHYLLLDV